MKIWRKLWQPPVIEYSDKVMHDFPPEGWDWAVGGVEGYNECEMFCGSWTLMRDENMEVSYFEALEGGPQVSNILLNIFKSIPYL